MQTEAKIFSIVKPLADVPLNQVAACRTWRDAFWVGYRNSNIVTELIQVAECIGKSKGYVSQIMKEGSRKNFNPTQLRDIQKLFGNKAIAQFSMLELEGQLNCQNKQSEYERAIAYAESIKPMEATQ